MTNHPIDSGRIQSAEYFPIDFLPDNLMAIKAAAHLLGISVNAIRLRKMRNSLPVKVYRVGGRLFLSLDEIYAFHKAGGWNKFSAQSKLNGSEA